MGRRYYKVKSGGKHHVKIEGKFHAWWLDVCIPNKTREKRQARLEIKKELS